MMLGRVRRNTNNMPQCTIIYNTGLMPAAQTDFESQLKALFKVLKKELGAQALALAELSIMLHDDAHLRDLNYQFRGVDKPTNVLSFPSENTQSVCRESHNTTPFACGGGG